MRTMAPVYGVLTAALLATSAFAKACPPLGPVLLPPQAPSKSDAVKSAAKELNATFSSLTSGFNTSGLAVVAKSIHEDDQLFSYYFTPPVHSGIGTKAVDENTIFRVGSLSKIFTALAVLQTSSISMDDSILKYIPELQNATASEAIDAIAWKDITIGSLMTQLSGIGRDTAFDLSIFPGPWISMGLPKVANGTGPSCSGFPGTKGCTAQQLIEELKHTQDLYLPFTTPSYSNVAFALLSMVLEAVTHKPFQSVIQSKIYNAVGMKSSSFFGPVKSFSSDGFVAEGEWSWNVTLGVFESAGGMFTTTSDLLAFAEGILKNQFLSPKATRQWLKPMTHTSAWGMSVGAPWEILRSDNITSDGRIVDVYTKSGDLGEYHAVMVVVPDYDIVVTILDGGAEVSTESSEQYVSAVVKAIVPAVEKAGREEASTSKGFTGTYKDGSTNSSMTLTLDSGPGLVITNFTVRGFDVLHHISSYNALSLSSTGPATEKSVDGRLYPSNIADKSKGQSLTAWRAIFDASTAAEQKAEDSQLFWKDGSCQTWFEVDFAQYDLFSLGDFTFTAEDDGSVKSITNEAFDVTLTKESSDIGCA